MAPNTAALATAIAALSVSGVTMKNITNMPRSVTKADCPIFFPDPSEWFLDMHTDDDLAFVGQAGQYDVMRKLKYVYIHAPSIAANPISTYYAAMAAKVDLLYNAIGAMNNGVAVVTKIGTSAFGELEAPTIGAGTIRNVFFGCFFEISFTELVNP